MNSTNDAAATRSITASYTDASRSETTLVINQSPTATTLVSSPNPSLFGQSVTFTATVTAAPVNTSTAGTPSITVASPTGTVTFKEGSTTLGTGTLNGSGQATFATSSLATGGHSITAVYSGDSNFATSTSPALTQTVNQATTSTVVTSSANPSTFGQAVTFTATVTSGGTPTGTVTFKDGAATLGTGTLNGSGVATFATSSLATGGHSITAVYSGDTNFSTSTSPALNQTVNPNTTSTAVTSSLNPSSFGQAVTFTATVTSAGSATGTVTFKDGSATLGTGTLNGSGQATFATSSLAAGSHSITAVYGGDSSFTGSTSPALTQTVNQAGSAVALSSSQNPSTFGQSVTFTATVTSGGAPTGTVTFKDGAATLGTGTLNGSGVATFTTAALAAGAHSITATYNGDANFSGSTSPVLTQTVTQGGTSTALSSSQNPSTFGQSVTFTATVTSGGGTPTGTVTFKDGGAVIGTGPLNGLGVATFTISTLAVGSHSITATYSGDANFTASTSPAVLQAVDVPADSLKLRALQIAVTKIVAQSSGQAISGAIDGAISDGFNEGGDLITPGANGLHFNFSAEPQEQPESKVEERVGDAFAAFGYAPRDKVVKAASPSPSPREPKDWVAWADVRGIGWNTSLQTGDIRGGQTNAVIGLTRKVTPNFLVGMLAGYEGFDYSSRLLNGNLKGKGWTLGGYLGWRLLPSLRFDAGLARSNIAYDGVAGTAAGSFTGERWLISGGLTGSYKMMSGLEIEPSARVYALWERENAYQDTLGFQQTERKFSTGRASAGAKLIYPWMWSATMTLAPYAGLYADYYFSKDDATTTLLLPSESVHGWSARINSGVALSIANGAKLSIGGEVGGLGSSQFINWSLRGYASIPF